MVKQEIGRSCAHGAAPCGIVLTGGTALLSNISGLAASILGMPVRVGLPQGMLGIKNNMRTPACTAGIGLLAYASRKEAYDELHRNTTGSILNRIKDRLTQVAEHRDFLEIMNKKKKGVSYV
jgi:cell division protein FtsA